MQPSLVIPASGNSQSHSPAANRHDHTPALLVQVHTPMTLLSTERTTVWSLGQSSANLSSLSLSGFCGNILYPVGYRHAIWPAVVPSTYLQGKSLHNAAVLCVQSLRLLGVTKCTFCRASAELHGRQCELQTRMSASCRLEYVVRQTHIHAMSFARHVMTVSANGKTSREE